MSQLPPHTMSAYKGRLMITYSWGNQRRRTSGRGRVRRKRCHFLKAWFPGPEQHERPARRFLLPITPTYGASSGYKRGAVLLSTIQDNPPSARLRGTGAGLVTRNRIEQRRDSAVQHNARRPPRSGRSSHRHATLRSVASIERTEVLGQAAQGDCSWYPRRAPVGVRASRCNASPSSMHEQVTQRWRSCSPRDVGEWSRSSVAALEEEPSGNALGGRGVSRYQDLSRPSSFSSSARDQRLHQRVAPR